MNKETKAERLTVVVHSADECLPDADTLVLAYGTIEGREDCGIDFFIAWYDPSDGNWHSAEFECNVSVIKWFYIPIEV